MRSYKIETAIEKLTEAGIPIRKYARGPSGKAIFIIGIGDRYKASERICLWPGLVETIELSIDKKLKQAVMSVYEDEQTISFIANVGRRYFNDNGSVSQNNKRLWRWHTRVNFPDGTEGVSVRNVDPLVPITDLYWRDDVRVEFTIKTPSDERHFFLGHDTDGKHVFISMLTEKANTVKEAHEILRPDSVPEGSLRQGEFFFVPTPDYRVREEYIKKNDRISSKIINGWSRVANLANLTDHRAEELIVNKSYNRQHVRGTITNPRHEPLVLDGWHLVVTNNEVPVPRNARQQWD